jgi:DNA-binding transcriptional LysR family regulator
MVVELRDLRYFVVLAEELHYRRAAKRLFITPSSLSKAVSRLEDSLGVDLLERSPRHVSLTDTGALVAGKAAEIIRAVDRLHAFVSTSRSANDLKAREASCMAEVGSAGGRN